jgi:hypothetical protein
MAKVANTAKEKMIAGMIRLDMRLYNVYFAFIKH